MKLDRERLAHMRELAQSILSAVQELEDIDAAPSWTEDRLNDYLDDCLPDMRGADAALGCALDDFAGEMVP